MEEKGKVKWEKIKPQLPSKTYLSALCDMYMCVFECEYFERWELVMNVLMSTRENCAMRENQRGVQQS